MSQLLFPVPLTLRNGADIHTFDIDAGLKPMRYLFSHISL